MQPGSMLHTFPELQDSGTPRLDSQGLPSINGVPFQNLRLYQLKDLARAWDIPINVDAPKPDILPALMAAGRQGVFRKPPRLPYYAWRAQINKDTRNPYNEPAWEYPDGPPKVEAPGPAPDELKGPPPTKDQKEADPFYKLYRAWTWPELKAKAREVRAGLNVHGLSRADLGRVLHDAGVSPEARYSKPVEAA